jgi:ABC-type branched-subunit amino acid transport system substrate-binding protein
MGTVVLVDEQLIPASPETVFDLFGRDSGDGWFFAATCSSVARGAAVHFDLPLPADPGIGGFLEGTGRIVEVDRPSRIVVLHETPWRGRVTCTIRRAGDQSRVRVTAELPEASLRWHLRRHGAVLPPEVEPGEAGIGLLLSLSGPFGIHGAGTENLARLAVEEVNQDGPPGGHPVRLVVGDDGTCPAVAAAEARRLVEDERCPVVVASVTSASFEAARPIVEKAGALLVFGLANAGGSEGPLTFRLGERSEDQLDPVVPRLMSASGGRHWYLAGNDYCWPRAVHARMRRTIARAGGQVVGEAFSPLGIRDLSPVLESISRSEADMVLSTFVGSDAVRFGRALHGAGLSQRCAVLASAMEEFVREHAGEPAAGSWAVWGYFRDLPTVENHAFLARYHARFSELAPPPSGISEAAYEAVHLVADAARRAGGWEPQEVASRLLTASFDGPRGRVRVLGRSRLVQHLYLAQATACGFAVRDEWKPWGPCIRSR